MEAQTKTQNREMVLKEKPTLMPAVSLRINIDGLAQGLQVKGRLSFPTHLTYERERVRRRHRFSRLPRLIFLFFLHGSHI